MPPHVIGQQSFVIGESAAATLCSSASSGPPQVDPQSFSESKEVAPGVTVAFGKLIDQLLDAGGDLGDDRLLFPA